MASLKSNRRFILLAFGATLVIGIFIGLNLWRPAGPQPVASSDRTRYAALYQAAWRSDDGSQPTLTTATLLVPQAIQLLGQDVGRSSTEEQEWQAVKDLKSNQLAIIMTLDSVAGDVPDDTILHGLSISGLGLHGELASWVPVIGPSRIVNTSTSASSQIGVAIFSADTTIDWPQLGPLTLTFHGLADGHDRVFTWANPNLLLQAQ